MPVVPPFLGPGSVIGITCPSGYVAPERIAHCTGMLERHGFTVVQGRTVGNGVHYMAGTDEERLHDLQSMLDDPGIDAIIMGRGGYGLSRIIDRVDLSAFAQKPKWICGFSDITVLHSHIHQLYGIPTLHSPMCGAFRPETENEAHIRSFFAALEGRSLRYEAPANPFNRAGSAEGLLVGGNLAILAHLSGSPSAISTEGKVLFLEDVGEYKYNIDRLLLNLKRSGRLRGLRGLILGGFTDTQDTDRPFGQEVQELIADKVREYGYPVCYDFPAGHQEINFALRLGMPHTLEVTEQGSLLTQTPDSIV